MCGIVGIFEFDINKLVDKDHVKKLNQSIIHRGPDDEGYFHDQNLALGHKRLSIIDLVSGNQPMHSFDNRFVIVFNGEIYNYKELKKDLIDLGYKFLTHSDTEVILNGYQAWGVNVQSKLNGEWAFAIWDKKERGLLISRDRYGIKPLYYSIDNEKLIFASEIKALIENGNYEPDFEQIWDSLVYGPKSGGKTQYKNITELHPGNYLLFKNGKYRQDAFYHLEEKLSKTGIKPDFEQIDFLLNDSVSKRLMSDVNIGTINSGGLDSSLISAIATQYFNRKLYTFSVAPEWENGKPLISDESQYAESLASQIRSKHTTVRYSRSKFVSEIPKSFYFNDGILFHSNSIPLSYMFSQIKNPHNTKVVLGGEGADEVFRGYSVNRQASLIRKMKIYPLKTAIILAMENKYPRIKLEKSKFSELSIYARMAIAQNMHLDPEDADQLLSFKGRMSEDRISLIHSMKELPPENQMIFYEQKCYLGGLLQRVDRMSLRWAVEARVPFLDHRLVDYMNSIDPKYKSGILEKNVKKTLKKVAKPYIDPLIIKRKKFGFSAPLADYAPEIKNTINRLSKNFSSPINNITDSQKLFIIYNYLLFTKS